MLRSFVLQERKLLLCFTYHEWSEFKDSDLSVLGPVIPTSQRYQYFIIHQKSVKKIVTAKLPIAVNGCDC